MANSIDCRGIVQKQRIILHRASTCKKKYEEKGYPRDLVTTAFLSNKTKRSKNKNNNSLDLTNTAKSVSTFNTKYREISKIIYKHYDILKRDLILVPVLPPKPQVTFRCSRMVKKTSLRPTD